MQNITQRLVPENKQVYQIFFRSIILLLVALAGSLPAFAQNTALVQGLKQYRSKTLQEKLYLHLDRPLYVCGETIWFKVYNVDGALHQPLTMSKVAYVEVLDDTQQPVLQGKISLKEGSGKGSFVLPLTLGSGNYTVRAYTSWMKNFSPDFYFAQPVTILNTYVKPELKPAGEAAYSVQFFPEGGNLVQGLQSKVAFKISDKNTGKGVHASGEVTDRAGNVIAVFQPSAFGIGHFTFTPAAGELYVATVKVAGKTALTGKLPVVQEQGYVLQLEEAGPAQVRISVQARLQQSEQVYLLVHARQMISTASAGVLVDGKASFLIAKDSLADGITHFTLFNSSNHPVCERLYFKRPGKVLDIAVGTGKDGFGKREKVNLAIETLTGAGRPVAANLSLSVFRLDEAQPAAATDISAYLWITSELKGNVENPAFYFSENTARTNEALDNLLLTHGWSRFKWEEVLTGKDTPYTFLPEYDGHLVQGRVKYVSTGAPAPGIQAFLAAPSRHVRLYNAVSDANGAIKFEVKDFFGQKEIFVQTDTRKDSTYRFEIFSPFSESYAARNLKAFDLSDSLHSAVSLRHTETEAQQLYFHRYRDRYRPAGVDSISFYGQPDQQYYLDDYIRFKVMEEVMREYVPGVMVRKRRGRFHFMVVNSPGKTVFQNDPLVLLDGVPVFNIDKIMDFDPLKVQRLDVITNRFFQGPLQYEGVVSYTTYKGNLAGFPLDPRALLMEYEGLQLEREFYAPAYETEEQQQSRLPDFRNLLHWAPELITKADGTAAVSFYTSDSAGRYLVVVQGMTQDGLFGSKTFMFEVKQPL